MDEFRRTIPRRHKLIKFIEEKLGEVQYDNEPIGYCMNEDCTVYKDHYHITMQSGMLQGIEEIERALRLLKRSVKESTIKDENNKEHKD